MKRQVCPRCKNDYEGHPAFSRVDDKTKICSRCSHIEADIDVFGLDRFPDERERHEEFVKKLKLISGKKVLKGRYWNLKES